MYNYIVVGAGLSGSIVARYLAETKEKKVLVVDKRNHIAGNLYDEYNTDNILCQIYGPHIFHTDSERVAEYVNKWVKWKEFHLKCMVFMNEKYTPSPFNFQTIDDYYEPQKAEELKKHIKEIYGDVEKETIVNLLQSEDPLIKEYADFLFANDYSLYTAKQWGISPSEIDVNVLKRVPVLFSYKDIYFDNKYQIMPDGGYTEFIREILNHPNITVQLNTNAIESMEFKDEEGKILYNGEEVPIIYTGAIDELLGYKHGALPYRSLKFEWKTFAQDSYQDAPVVAYPQVDGYTRITEYNKLPLQEKNGKTTIAIEYPLQVEENSKDEPYYPIPTEKNAENYNKYKDEVNRYTNIVLLGRLAEYKYYDMDKIVINALELCDKL